MRMCGALVLTALTGATLAIAAPGTTRELTFDQRVEAQRAIERVYLTHQAGDTGRSDRSIPTELLREKVRSYLRKSAALETLWHVPVTPAMLRAEVERMAVSTRMPDRLRELYAALGNDPILVQECLARPVLVDRLARASFASNPRFRHGDPGVEAPPASASGGDAHPTWDAWWIVAQARFDETSVRSVAVGTPLPEPAPSTASWRDPVAAAASCSAEGVWVPMRSDNVPAFRNGATTVWTGSVMILWGGYYGSVPYETGGRYDPAIDAWFPVSRLNAPAPRQGHVAVWTGSRMIVWGGYGTYPDAPVSGGGLYDPLADTWTAMDTSTAPSGRWNAPAVWTGSEMVVWGGYDGAASLDTGGRYDPTSNSWSIMSTAGAPSARSGHSAVWTGSRMVVWGGGFMNDGALYDPSTDTWATMTTEGAPQGRAGHAAVWTGMEMIVWGGHDGSGDTATGGRYDPTTDQWRGVSTSGAPAETFGVSVVGIGSAMLVWGGLTPSGDTNEGVIYDPASDSWSAISSLNAPSPRRFAAALWTGSSVLIWGGVDSRVGALADGGRYDVAAGAWTPIASYPIPPLRGRPVWTGSVMLVWPTVGLGGHKYDPLTDAWTPISSDGAPAIQGAFTSVWTGSSMIVWGEGAQPYPSPGIGGVYDPVSDTWTLTASAGAPASRFGHTAVWTGTRMIVFGGFYKSFGDTFALGDGTSFDPQTDSWSPIAASGLFPRGNHSAVWTGSRMVIWGGLSGDVLMGYPTLGDGSRYDPATDTWSAIASTDAPVARHLHSAIWTGLRMIVWGGEACSGGPSCIQLASGSRYNPVMNTWSPVGTAGDPPPPMSGHAAVWTTQVMIVYKGPGSGGQYSPMNDAWVHVASTDASALLGGAVWTGSAMIVGTSLFFPDVNRDADGDGWAPCDGDCDDARASIHPGVADVCNGIDDDCSGATDDGGPALCADGEDCTSDQCGASRGCLNPMAPDGTICSDGDACTIADSCLSGTCRPGPPRDADADAHADASCGGDDCDDADAAVWNPAPPIARMVASAGTPTLSWEDQGPLAGPGTVYDLYSGMLSSMGHPDFSTGSCLMTGGPPFFDATGPEPAPGAAFWYLARSRNGCGVSTWGSPDADARIQSCP